MIKILFCFPKQSRIFLRRFRETAKNGVDNPANIEYNNVINHDNGYRMTMPCNEVRFALWQA